MSQYRCSCGAKTEVIDTRPSYTRLRRRRKCSENHRFSTVEIPLDTVLRLKELILFWANALEEDDMVEHMNRNIDIIMLGMPSTD